MERHCGQQPRQEHPRGNDRTIPAASVLNLGDSLSVHAELRCVGRVFCDKQIKNTTIHSVLKHAWERYDGVRMKDLTDDVVLFEFDNKEDFDDAFDYCPWAIRGHCLSLRQWSTGMAVEDVRFDTIQFWVQIHGLESGKISRGNAEMIGAYIGTFVDIVDSVFR